MIRILNSHPASSYYTLKLPQVTVARGMMGKRESNVREREEKDGEMSVSKKDLPPLDFRTFSRWNGILLLNENGKSNRFFLDFFCLELSILLSHSMFFHSSLSFRTEVSFLLHSHQRAAFDTIHTLFNTFYFLVLCIPESESSVSVTVCPFPSFTISYVLRERMILSLSPTLFSSIGVNTFH